MRGDYTSTTTVVKALVRLADGVWVDVAAIAALEERKHTTNVVTVVTLDSGARLDVPLSADDIIERCKVAQKK